MKFDPNLNLHTAAKALQNIKIANDPSVAIKPEHFPIGQRGVMKLMVIQLETHLSKIVIHASPLSRTEMECLSQTLLGIVQRLNIEGASAEGDFGVYNIKQWDFVYLGIPVFQADEIKKHIIQQVTEAMNGRER